MASSVRYQNPYAPPQRSNPAGGDLLTDLLTRLLSGWRLELLLAAVLLLPVAVGCRTGLLWPALLLDVAVLLVVVGVGRWRRRLRDALYAAVVRRQFRTAVRSACIWPFAGQLPVIRGVSRIPAGETLDVRVPLGGHPGCLAEEADTLAAALQVRELRVDRDPDNARRATVTLIRRDPLAEPAPVWPAAEKPRCSLWEPIPVGVDERGNQVTISLPERNVLLGGEPGAGKSAALSLLVATAALDPTVKVHLFDGKLVELAAWAGCAEHTVGVDTEQANLVLRGLQVEMDARYLTLLANRARKVTPDMDLPLHVLVVDELAHYLLAPDRKVRAEFAELLRDLVARGRAAGLIVLAATQKPAHDIIPTALRDLFGFRWAMRCNTPHASDTVLGAGWASQGYSAASIDAATRGVGYLLAEGGRPTRLRCHYLDDPTLDQLARRAEQQRHRDPAADPGQTPVSTSHTASETTGRTA